MGKKIYQRIFQILTKKQKRNFILILGIMIVSAVLTQLLSLSIGSLTDDVLSQEQVSFFSVLPFLGFILGITIINEMIKVIRRLLVEDTATRFEKKARTAAIFSLLHAPLTYFKEHMTGNIHGKLNRSLEGTTKLLKLLFMDFAPAIFNALAAIAVLYGKLPFSLASLMLLVIPIGVFIVLRQITTQKGIRVELMNEKTNMDGSMVELMNGIEVIRVVDYAEGETNRLDQKSEGLRKKEMKHHKAMAFYDCLKFINEAVFTVLVIGIAAYLAGEGKISVGTVLTAYLSFTQLTNPLRELHRILDELAESTVLAEEYFKILDLPKDFSYLTLPSSKKIKESPVILSVRNLSFQYENTDPKILHHLSFGIKKGEFLGIAGPSGCGKSTLMKVLCKLEPGEGEIQIAGYDLTLLDRHEIAKDITFVPQNPFLISASIKENVCYGLSREVSLEEVKSACKKACLDDFIESLPQKYDTIIAEGGKNLSGGQRQRLSLARAFLRTPLILILDEATSALDNTTEKKIQKNLEQFQKENDITILSIAHRLSTLEHCDRIFVFDQGKIVQEGKFTELVQQEGIFQDMYRGILK